MELQKNLIASYGRRRGRPITEDKKLLFDNLLPKITFRSSEFCELQSKYNEICIEIGFGRGEHIIHQASANPDKCFIGSEVYENGIASLLYKINDLKTSNIRIFKEDARIMLQNIPDESIDKVFVLFPDPWPKTKHHKRRIINKDTLDMFSRIMKNGSELRIATDHADYLPWIMVQMTNHNGFTWLAKTPNDWKVAPEGYIQTKYAKKAEREGRTSVFLNFIKQQS